ncbi:MAG: hypothetical protein ACLP6G_04200 [Terriglobales bacterium]
MSIAFQLTLAKYGTDVPDGWLLVLWVVPLVPFGWWLWTHDKLLTRRDKLKQYFRLHPWRATLATVAVCLIVASCLGGVGYIGWRMLRVRHENAKETVTAVAPLTAASVPSTAPSIQATPQKKVKAQDNPQHANDPYDGYSDEWLAATAMAEATKIQQLGTLCMNDMDDVLNNKPAMNFHTSTLDGVRFFFTVRMKECCIDDTHKLHDSILARAPNLRDPELESQFAFELLNQKGGCSSDEVSGIGVLVKYLRDLASGLRNQKPPSP